MYLLFHDEDQFSLGLERVPEQQDLGMTEQVHDGDLLKTLVALSCSQANELGSERRPTA